MAEFVERFEIFEDVPTKLKKVIKLFYVFSDYNGYNALFVTLDDIVFGLGHNDRGVCGLGHEMVVNEPNVIQELCHKSVKQFFNGYNFALALTSDNVLYGWGDNNY